MSESANQILRDIYAVRSANRAYSLRAFARDLGLSHTYLSLLFHDKKRLPASTLRSLSDKLGLSPERVEKVTEGRGSGDFSRLELDTFRLLYRWYYIAILDLVNLTGFTFTVPAIAAYLAIDPDEVREALATLKRLGILHQVKGKWIKSEERFSIVVPKSMEAIRAYHRQMIALALGELQLVGDHDFKQRDITGMTMPINPKRLAGAKRKIARFRRALEAYLTQGECTEVYQFNLQLFPLRGGGRKSGRGQEGL